MANSGELRRIEEINDKKIAAKCRQILTNVSDVSTTVILSSNQQLNSANEGRFLLFLHLLKIPNYTFFDLFIQFGTEKMGNFKKNKIGVPFASPAD